MMNAGTRTPPRVILLGGAPKSGKSTLARHLATRLESDLVATDDLGVAARAVTSPGTHPDLHPMAGEDWREYYVRRSVDTLWSDALRTHRALWPAILAAIRVHATWGRPAVIDGWALLPDLVAATPVAGVGAAWLVVAPDVLEARVREQRDFYAGATDEEAMIGKFVARSERYQAHVRNQAQPRGLPVLRVAPQETVESLGERVLSAVAASGSLASRASS